MERADHDDHSVPQEIWEKLIGRNNSWDGLLEPNLNIDLRKFIIRCGEFCQAAYDAFTGADKNCRDVKMRNPHRYQIHEHLYATTHLNIVEKLLHIPALLKPPAAGEHEPNWMGYCAATTDQVSRAIGRREIYIAWRGTQRLFEWRNNLMFRRSKAKCLIRNFNRRNKPKVMHGWLSIYTSTDEASSSHVKKSARDQVKDVVQSLMGKYKGENISIVVTGHSLGGVLAILSAFDLVENTVGKDIPVAAVVFSTPKVGNEAFKETVEQHPNLKILHVKDASDMVPQFPLIRYVPVGKELVVDINYSPIPRLKDSLNPSVFHDLEAVLHMVSGWNGPGKAFKLHVYRCTDRLMQNTKPLTYIKSEIQTWFCKVKQLIEEN